MNDVGLVIWGCKGGHRIFCANGAVDVKSPEVVNTIKDLRGFLRFVESRVTLYAIEFTSDYQVYTLYRSCRDAGNGAFVAFSVFVPHRRRLPGLRELMNNMADHYFAEYIHPMSNAYLPNKYDDINPYNMMLGELNLVDDAVKYHICSSKQDDTPALYLFKSLDEVDEFFSTPYRPEFFEHQEVLFMAQDVFDRVPSTLMFNTPNPTILREVSQPINKARLVWPTFFKNLDMKRTSIEVNGKVCSPDASIYVDEEDSVEYCFQKDAYHSEIASKGTVTALLEKKILSKRGDDFIFNESKFCFEAKVFPYSIMLKLDDGTRILAPENVLTLIPNNDPYGSNRKVTESQVTFKGTEIKKEWRYEIKPISSSNVVFQGEYTFVPENLSNITIDVHKLEYSLKTETPGQAVLLVGIGKETCRITVRANKSEDLTIWLPNNIRPEEVQFSSEGNELNINGRQIIISPKTPEFVTYEMRLPKDEAAREFLSGWNILYRDKECREGDKVVLPYGANIGECRFVVSGKDEISLFVEEIAGSNQLVPLGCILTINKTEKKVLSLECDGVCLGEPTTKLDAYKYTKSREDKYTIVEITSKQKKGEESSQGEDKPAHKGANYRLRLINCKGYSIDGNEIDDDDKSLSVTTSEVRMKKSGEDVCSINLKSRNYKVHDDKLRLAWKDDTCIIALYRLECIGCSGLLLNGYEIVEDEKSYDLRKTSTLIEIKEGKKLVCSVSLENPKDPSITIKDKFRDCIEITVNEYSCTIIYRKESGKVKNLFQSLFKKKGICFGLLGLLTIIALYFLYPVFKNEKVDVWKMAFVLDKESEDFGSSIKDFDLIDGGEFFAMKADTLYLSLDRKACKNLSETRVQVKGFLQKMSIKISFEEGGSTEKKVYYERDGIERAFNSLHDNNEAVVVEGKVSSQAYEGFCVLEEDTKTNDSAFFESCKSYRAFYKSETIINKVEELLWEKIKTSTDTIVLSYARDNFDDLKDKIDLRINEIKAQETEAAENEEKMRKAGEFITILKSGDCSKEIFYQAKSFYDGNISIRTYNNFSGCILAYGALFAELEKETPQMDPFKSIVAMYPSTWGNNQSILKRIVKDSNTFKYGSKVLKDGGKMSEVEPRLQDLGL